MIAYIALGSNMGDRLAWLKAAREKIAQLSEVTLLASSRLYVTAPYGYTQQADFLNAVIKVTTTYSPHELLEHLQQIEQDLDRVREIHWGPRTIDLDVLLMDELKVNEPDLVIPHPELLKRSFVLVPLKDVHPEKLFEQTLTKWITETGNQADVRSAKEEW